jgi:hypothetical protein
MDTAPAHPRSRPSLTVAPPQRAGARAWPANRLEGTESGHTGGRPATAGTARGRPARDGAGLVRTASRGDSVDCVSDVEGAQVVAAQGVDGGLSGEFGGMVPAPGA